MSTAHSSIEPLEARIAPASILNVITSAAGVSIAEDKANPGNSTITLTVEADGDLAITVDVGTQLKVNGAAALPGGTGFTVDGFSGGIIAKLGVGSDSLTITGQVPKSVKVDLGKGADLNSLTLTDASIGGALSVVSGEANDLITFGGSTVNLYGPVSLKLGDGGNQLVNTTNILATGGNFVALGGKGADSFQMGGANVSILGKLDLNTGSGSDTAGFDVSGLLTIGAGVSIKAAGSAGTTSQVLNATSAVGVFGAVVLDVKTGRALQQITSSGGPVVLGSLSATSGVGSGTTVQVEGKSYLSIAGSVTAKTKGAGADFDVKATDINGLIGGKLTVSGFEEVIAEFNGAIGGAVKLDLPVAQDGYVFLGTKLAQTAPLYLGAVSITAKSDSNILALSNTVVQGALKVKGAQTGDDDFVLDDTLLAAASVVDLGGGFNRFLIETGTNPPKTSQLLAPLLLKGGADTDQFTFGGNVANATLRAVAQITLDGGADTDTVTLGNATFLTPLVQKNIP